MIKSADAFRTISEVSELLGTPAHVLRFWESRFPQIRPLKRAGGRRYYRPEDVALLAGIKKLLHSDGLTIRGVQKILKEQGTAAVAALAEALVIPEDTAAAEDMANAGTLSAPEAPPRPARHRSPSPGLQGRAEGSSPDRMAESPPAPPAAQAPPAASPAATPLDHAQDRKAASTQGPPPKAQELTSAPPAVTADPFGRVVSLLVQGSGAVASSAPMDRGIERESAPAPDLWALRKSLPARLPDHLPPVERMRLLAAYDRLLALRKRLSAGR